ncbi:hypothetical protein PR202_gb04837 [Eleusine coracana subsp. coracana]|uniref:PARP-type domain-containing protein n=1 Tax=Eleusine coracana subsp. coracana TaxID=191504 RepID=A0AAV5E5J5_ELECO|nr:hypothetical protein PR202_gb04837 [Eleusine coracana subsp. coracana]
MSTSPPAVTVSVEYAKSGRSTCKECGAAIASGALRLGTSSRDPRGFDSTKWYHVACFPAASHPLGPVESIDGFDAIKVCSLGRSSYLDDDREELRQLEKNHKTNQSAVGPLEEPSLKKVKTQASPAEEASISVEYAKSGRSTCKGCNESIDKGSLRIGASFHDPRGFESTKWYHVFCFPTSLYPVPPFEHLKGFDSIEEHDREKLQKLEKDGNSEELRELEKNHKTNQDVVAPLKESSSEKVKTQVSSPAEGASDKASVSVEYAKSGRSTCKGCNENIDKGALRIGASFHDPRGFESTKWYHVGCFPTSLYPVPPVEHLKGFDSIEDHDREKLKKLEKSHKKADASVGPLDKPSPKKVKEVSGEASIYVEYAKSGRSTCKGCNDNIAKGALRLGASTHNPRGFDSTKWYHVACFPTSSYPVFPVENLKGFDSIENQDREKLRELQENHKREDNPDQSNEPNSKEEMVGL